MKQYFILFEPHYFVLRKISALFNFKTLFICESCLLKRYYLYFCRFPNDYI